MCRAMGKRSWNAERKARERRDGAVQPGTCPSDFQPRLPDRRSFSALSQLTEIVNLFSFVVERLNSRRRFQSLPADSPSMKLRLPARTDCTLKFMGSGKAGGSAVEMRRNQSCIRPAVRSRPAKWSYLPRLSSFATSTRISPKSASGCARTDCRDISVHAAVHNPLRQEKWARILA